MNLPPLTNPDDEGLDLGWHALNYRTAHTMHAEAMWQELKRYVENWGESCARMAREEERERCAKVCEELIAFDEDDPGQAPADHIRIGAEPGEWVRDHAERAAAIRKG